MIQTVEKVEIELPEQILKTEQWTRSVPGVSDPRLRVAYPRPLAKHTCDDVLGYSGDCLGAYDRERRILPAANSNSYRRVARKSSSSFRAAAQTLCADVASAAI
jgi:hypothetical protein